MDAREKYQQQLNTLDEALLSGSIQVGDTIYHLRTAIGWQAYEQEVARLKEIGSELLIEEAQQPERQSA